MGSNPSNRFIFHDNYCTINTVGVHLYIAVRHTPWSTRTLRRNKHWGLLKSLWKKSGGVVGQRTKGGVEGCTQRAVKKWKAKSGAGRKWKEDPTLWVTQMERTRPNKKQKNTHTPQQPRCTLQAAEHTFQGLDFPNDTRCAVTTGSGIPSSEPLPSISITFMNQLDPATSKLTTPTYRRVYVRGGGGGGG